jgi:tetratricopeptide (TPR) repeat protein
VTLLVWGHTLSFDFVWDDTHFIRELKSIRSLKNTPEMFYSLDAQSSFPQGFVLFRPLRTLHYALLYWAGGQSEPQPWIYHLANVVWHAAATVLFFSVLLLLFQRQAGLDPARVRAFAFVISLGFAVQPVVSEVVCWAKSLDDIMATVFTLAAARALLKCDGSNKQYRWALLYFLLAVYSKESAVPFALVAFFLFWLFHRLSPRQALERTAGFMAIAFLFVVHRHLVIGRTSQTAPISGTYAQTLVDMFPVVPKYLRLLCGAPPFCIDYAYLPGHHSIFSAPVIVGAVLLTALIGVTLWACRRPDFTLIGLGLLWVGLFLLPVSNLLPMMQYMAERFLYLPLIGWLLALGALLIKLRRRTLGLAVATLIVSVWALLAWQRSFIWKDALTLFVRSSQEGSRTLRMEQNAVYAIFHLPQIEDLFRLNDAARLEIRPGITPENGARALKTLDEARRTFPRDENLLFATGVTYAQLGLPAKAVEYFESAVQINPRSAEYWSDLALARLDAGQIAGAREALEKSLSLQPDRIDTLRSASRLYWQAEDFAAALKVLKKLQQLEPDNKDHPHWIHEAEQRLSKTAQQ